MAEAARKLLTVDEYLQMTGDDETHYELIDGVIYAMAPPRTYHGLITSKLNTKLGVHLAGTPCRIYNEPIQVKIDDISMYSPDVMVDCSDAQENTLYRETPILIVEVLSPSTRRYDQTVKLRKYLTIPTLKEYILIEQNCADVEVLRQDNDWHPEHYFLGDEVTLTSIDLTLSVEDIYEWVNNDDMQEWLAQKEESDKSDSAYQT